MRSVTGFVRELATLQFNNVFNPYSDRCCRFDLPDAASIRRRNLECVLSDALKHGVDGVWVARDLGHRGGRRTGLAMTDDTHLGNHARMFGVSGVRRATIEPDVSEATARVIWRALHKIRRRIFLWNVFPLHPHDVSNPLSNRRHTRYESETCEPLLRWVLDNLKPETLVGIGEDAHSALAKAGYACRKTRHPSYGGQPQFIAEIGKLYGVDLV